jgi:hypothetical protein
LKVFDQGLNAAKFGVLRIVELLDDRQIED